MASISLLFDYPEKSVLTCIYRGWRFCFRERKGAGRGAGHVECSLLKGFRSVNRSPDLVSEVYNPKPSLKQEVNHRERWFPRVAIVGLSLCSGWRDSIQYCLSPRLSKGEI
jgi:hypothetical protein